jgi:hypothetical protein
LFNPVRKISQKKNPVRKISQKKNPVRKRFGGGSGEFDAPQASY